MKKKNSVFEPAINYAQSQDPVVSQWSLKLGKGNYTWATKMDRVALIRKGLPFSSIEVISKNAGMPIKSILQLLNIPQTTYNKSKRENALMSSRNSEIILILSELLSYGKEVFNNEEEKFHRWLKKPNTSLGGARPDSYFDSVTGIQIVRNALNRIEYGNFA